MRENRKLVSQTFMYLMVPLHAVRIGVLMFVTEVMVIFAIQLNDIQAQALSTTDPTTTGGIDVTNVLAFAAPNIGFLRGFALIVTIVLTIVDTWSPHATSGGHHHKVWLFLAIMMVMSGVALMGIPAVVSGLFESVSSGLETTSTTPTVP
jgi:flagellar protein FlaJ